MRSINKFEMDRSILLKPKERTLVKPTTATLVNTRAEMPVHPDLADKPRWNVSTEVDRKEREMKAKESYVSRHNINI